MKKTFKRLGAVLLAAFMLLSTTICALADDTPQATTPTTNKTITLNVSNVNDGDIVSAYQLVSYTADYNSYTFFDGDGTKKGFKTYIENQTDRDGKTAEKYLAGLDAAGVNKLLEGYATACKQGESQYKLPNATAAAEASANTASLTLMPGYYLLLTKTNSENNRIYTPIAAFVKMDGENLVVYAGDKKNALTAGTDDAYTVSAKSENGPTIDKKTNATKGDSKPTWKQTAAAGVGDLVRFYVKVNIPAYNNVTALNLTVNDTLTNLKYNNDSVKVYDAEPVLSHDGVSGTVIDGAIKSQSIGEYTVSNGTGSQKLTFDLDYAKIMNGSQQEKSVYVYYETTVQKEAVAEKTHIGENIANLTYANAATPDSKYNTDYQDTKVYNYYLKFSKKKDEKDEALKGAMFSLYLDKTSNDAIKFVKETDKDGTEYYRPAAEGESNTVTEIEADFLIRGLDANTYYLKETKTPAGYYAPSDRFEIKLISKMENGIHTGKLNAESSKMYAVNDKDSNLILNSGVDPNTPHEISAAIKNFSTPNLPTTGGTGTVLLSIGGVVLMAAGAYLLFFRKKKEN